MSSPQIHNMDKIMLFICGSFNPPTLMHLRMFEIARNHIENTEHVEVIGGIVSPVHELYKKPNVKLASNEHRMEMIRLSLLSSDWIRLSQWEMQQADFTPTTKVLQYHQNYLNEILRDKSHNGMDIPSWLPATITDYVGQNVRIKILYGADILSSFTASNDCIHSTVGVPWSNDEIQSMLENHGLVVLSRGNVNIQKIILESDLLSKLKAHITIVENLERNEISSTLARSFLQSGKSVKYLLNDDVIDYIYKNKLFDSDTAPRELV